MESDNQKSSEKGKIENTVRWEIDTSTPFKSVKEAVMKFGGYGNWKRSEFKLSQSQNGVEETNLAQVEDGEEEVNAMPMEDSVEAVHMAKVEEQPALLETDFMVWKSLTSEGLKELKSKLEKQETGVRTGSVAEQIALLKRDLIAKEMDAFNVLKELDATKLMARELESKLKKQETEINTVSMSFSDGKIVRPLFGEENQNLVGGFIPCPSSTLNPSLVLTELNQDNLKLSRISNTRALVELQKELDEERASLEKTRERQALNISKISALEEDLNQMKLKFQLAKDIGNNISGEQLNFEEHNMEIERFKKKGKAAKDEGFRALAEIEHKKPKIRTEDIISHVARKLKEKGRAADGVTFTLDEYSSLTCKAREAEERFNKKVSDAMRQVDSAIESQMQTMKKEEEVRGKFETSKKELTEALNRLEAANEGKRAAEEALRKCKSEYSTQIVTKFRNISSSSSHRTMEPSLSIVPDNFETKKPEKKGLIKGKISWAKSLVGKMATVSWMKERLRGKNTTSSSQERERRLHMLSLGCCLPKQNMNKMRTTPISE